MVGQLIYMKKNNVLSAQSTFFSSFLIVMLLIFLSGCFRVPDRLLVNYNHSRHGFQENPSYYIREKPITVREYLLFLCWNIDVYGDSYPDKVKELFIDVSSETEPVKNGDFSSMLEVLINGKKRYMFIPRNIDFPLIGLNENQLKELYKWLTDRYNENMLINIKHYNFNANQKDEDNYSLEASLCNYYQGDIRLIGKPKWSDNMYLPLFHPPYSGVRPYDKAKYRLINKLLEWRSYKMERTDFLWRWNKYYLKENRGAIELEIPYGITIYDDPFYDEPYVTSYSVFLNEKSVEFTDTKYIDDVDRVEKNIYGRMNFSIIGEDSFNRPIVKDSIIYDLDRNPEKCLYWIVCNKEIELKNWP